MENWWYAWGVIIVALILIYFPRKKRRRFIVSQKKLKNKILRKDMKEKNIMKELAQRFIGKDCYIKLLEGSADGFVKDVTESGIMLEKEGQIQVVNLDYVMKIQEYPYKKGKRATIWGE